MKLEGEQKLLRVFVGEQDRWEGRPLYEAIIDEARERRLAGATALKGFMGFGRNAHLHTVKILELSEDLPVIVEIVDAADKIKAFLPRLDEMVKEGLITMEAVHVIAYRAEGKGRAKKA